MSSCPVAPPLDAASLRRVIPVAQHQQVEDVGITIYSLEIYARGCVAVVRTDWVGPAGPFPGTTWVVRDDIGNEYAAIGGGGSGGGRLPERNSWRTDQIFVPAPPPEATTLTLEVATFRLRVVTKAGPAKTATREVAGPWRFIVDLHADGA